MGSKSKYNVGDFVVIRDNLEINQRISETAGIVHANYTPYLNRGKLVKLEKESSDGYHLLGNYIVFDSVIDERLTKDVNKELRSYGGELTVHSLEQWIRYSHNFKYRNFCTIPEDSSIGKAKWLINNYPFQKPTTSEKMREAIAIEKYPVGTEIRCLAAGGTYTIKSGDVISGDKYIYVRAPGRGAVAKVYDDDLGHWATIIHKTEDGSANRLEEAKKKFPAGTRFTSAFGSDGTVAKSSDINADRYGNIYSNSSQSRCLYDIDSKKWAEIKTQDTGEELYKAYKVEALKKYKIGMKVKCPQGYGTKVLRDLEMRHGESNSGKDGNIVSTNHGIYLCYKGKWAEIIEKDSSKMERAKKDYISGMDITCACDHEEFTIPFSFTIQEDSRGNIKIDRPNTDSIYLYYNNHERWAKIVEKEVVDRIPEARRRYKKGMTIMFTTSNDTHNLYSDIITQNRDGDVFFAGGRVYNAEKDLWSTIVETPSSTESNLDKAERLYKKGMRLSCAQDGERWVFNEGTIRSAPNGSIIIERSSHINFVLYRSMTKTWAGILETSNSSSSSSSQVQQVLPPTQTATKVNLTINKNKNKFKI